MTIDKDADSYAEPVTATKISSVVSCDRANIQRAIESASIAQKLYYKSTTGAQRGVLLRKWYDLIVANADDCESVEINNFVISIIIY
jgi:succinate-semialdehyde dehydrogenase/glutarate-semialdehyde dehydrogenase